MLADAATSALSNVVILAGLPFLGFWLYHRKRHGRTLAETARRAGLQWGDVRFIWYCAAPALAIVAYLILWTPDPEPWTREGSAHREFAGLGPSATSIAMAFLYGMVRTGFAEELLFRGLIAGSLGRAMSLPWANILQALVFLAPHLLLLTVMPEAWPILLLVLAGGLYTGWVRIRSGSVVGPWLLHGAVNTAVSIMVAPDSP